MRVYLSPCGMGVGHVSRCKAIVDALVERGWPVLVSTYSSGLEYASRLGYTTAETVPLWMKMDNEGRIDFKRTAATSPGFFRGLWSLVRQVVAEIKNIQHFKPSLVISDTRMSSLIAARFLGVPSLAILNQFKVRIARRPGKGGLRPLDRVFFFIANLVWWFVSVVIGWVWSFAEKILIPDLPPPHTVSSNNLSIPRRYARKVEFVGPLLGASFCNSPKRVAQGRSGRATGMPLILVPLSVSPEEGYVFTRRIEKILEELSSRYQIVMSRGRASGSTEAERKGNLTIYDWIVGLDEYLEACDLVVSRAGQVTVLSSLAYGKPLLIIPIPDHPEQLGNARRASELGVATVLAAEELTAPLLDSTIDRMLNSPEYAKRAAEIRDLTCRMNGLEKVIAAVAQLSQEGGRPC